MITIPKNPIAAQSKANPPPPEYLLMAAAVQSTLGPKVEKPSGK